MRNKANFFKSKKKGKVAVFIILAIVIVIGIVLFFVLRGKIFQETIPQELEQVYDYYLSCIEQESLDAILISGGKGGYIESPEFSPGNEYMPFSNQLDFFGTGIPYWYYITSNGFIEEQVPSKTEIQKQLNDYLEERLDECDFFNFEDKGEGQNCSSLYKFKDEYCKKYNCKIKKIKVPVYPLSYFLNQIPFERFPYISYIKVRR